MSSKTVVKLSGYKSRTTKARIGAEVSGFMDDDKQFAVIINSDQEALLKTAKGSYPLAKHETANRFQGTCNGIKVHFCPKQVIATLHYWS